MKAEERRSHERILSCYEGMLATLNRIGPSSDSREDLEAFGEVKDYLLDRIEERSDILRNARSGRVSSRHRGNSLHHRDNAPNNADLAGVDNG